MVDLFSWPAALEEAIDAPEGEKAEEPLRGRGLMREKASADGSKTEKMTVLIMLQKEAVIRNKYLT